MRVPRAGPLGETSLRAVKGTLAPVSGRNRQAKSSQSNRPVPSMASASGERYFLSTSILARPRTQPLMGAESLCTVHWDGKRSEGKALLETDHLIFRGTFRLNIPRKSITKLDAANGTLRVTFPDGTASFELGPTAAKWADKIKNPPSLLDKLGVKPGMRVAVIGIDDADFLAQLEQRTSAISRKAPKKDSEIIFFGADDVADLARLEKLRGYLTPSGAIWVVHTKGKLATFKDTDVFTAAKRAKLVDVKVASFSATHTAEKLVIPVAQRP